MKKITLTEQEELGIYELLFQYLYYNSKNPLTVGALGISPAGYVGLIHLWERLGINQSKTKTNYKALLRAMIDSQK